MDNDPLDALFEKTEDIIGESRVMLVNLVLPFVAIDGESGKLFLKAEWSKISNSKKKILVVFLAQFALSLKYNEFPPTLFPKEIEDITGMPGGTIRPKVRELVEERLLKENGEGACLFRSTPTAIRSAYDLLESEINAK